MSPFIVTKYKCYSILVKLQQVAVLKVPDFVQYCFLVDFDYVEVFVGEQFWALKGTVKDFSDRDHNWLCILYLNFDYLSNEPLKEEEWAKTHSVVTQAKLSLQFIDFRLQQDHAVFLTFIFEAEL